MNRTKIIVMGILLLALASNTARADEVDQLKQQLDEQKQLLLKMQERLEQLEEKQTKVAEVPIDQKKFSEMVSKVLKEEKADLGLVPDWINNVTIKGDLRYRHEWMDDERRSWGDSNRHRIRARIGIYGKVNDEVDYGFRLASGNSATATQSATTTNQDLEDAFSSKGIWLDLAYFDYHPDAITGLKVLGGKFKNPYFFPGNNNLMYDTDVTPEGIAASYKTKWTDNVDLFGIAGGHYVRETGSGSSDGDDSGLFAAQAGATYRIPDMEKTYVTAGGGYFDYGNTKGKTALSAFAGNKSADTTTYDSDFDIAQGFVEVGFPVSGLPVKVFGDYLKNTSAKSSEDTGYLIGASIGKCKKQGSWQFGYNYRDLEADAVIGALTEGTFAGGGTNVKGHTLSLGYQLAKNVQMGLSYFVAERTDSSTDVTTDHDVILVDMKFKF